MRLKILLLLFLTISVFSIELPSFEEGMGENSPHWQYAKDRENSLLWNKSKKIYLQGKDKIFLQKDSYQIPKIAHFVWVGPLPYPPDSVENIRSWIAMHPDWKFIFWTDRPRPLPVEGMQVEYIQNFPFIFFKDLFKTTNNYGEQSDLLRYEILYQMGGVYVDHDANALLPFDSLHQNFDFYCCLEAPHPDIADRWLTFGTGVIASKDHHPVILKIIEHFLDNWFVVEKKYKRKGFVKNEMVLERTYLPLTVVMENQFHEDNPSWIILPSNFFFAKAGQTPLFSKHFFANSWDEKKNVDEIKSKKLIQYINKKEKKLLLYFIILSILILASSIIVKMRFRKI